MPGNVFTQSDEHPWIIDTKVSSDGEGAMRSGKIGINESTWIETVINGPGKLTFKWKASSEYYEDKSSGVYEIYDYGYFMVDGYPMGGLDDNFMTNGIAIGGHTDWQDVEFDVTGEGEHTLRWTYQKDKYDDEQMIGEDCIWVDQIKFRPMVTLGFDLGGGVGIVTEEIIELSETVVELPSDDGFGLTDHVFEGWYDGSRLYAGGASYEMPKTNAVLTVMWIAKRFHTFDLNGGVGEVPAVIKDIPGAKITLPNANGFHRDYYTFAGWNDGSETYAANATYTVGSEGVEFTAMWIAKRFHTFDLNGGVGEVPAVIKDIPGAKITLPNANGFHRDCYTFAGWNDGSETYAANATYTVGSEGVEFTAVWEANTIEAPVISSSSVADGGILDAASATITITCDAGAIVYYTLDGSTPTASSERYTGAFEVFDLGEVEIKAVALRGNYFDSSVATFAYTRKAYTLAECLNAGSWSVSSVAPAWFRVQGDAAHDGNEALRSGAIGANESSTVEMTVYGEGTISFWWKVSSHDPRGRKYDHVAFFVEDEEVTWISGEQDWANVTYSIIGKGTHTLKWVYKKNGDTSVAGEDCAWLDEVVWMGGDKFDITYENLKGATHTNPETYQERSVVEFTDPSEVEGYTFAGWTPERITSDMTGAQAVRANWTANNYTIEYNSNGGTGTMEATLATYDSEAIVKDNEFIRDGYTFKGWALEEGADVVYAPKQSVMNLTAQLNGVVTFYAVWERILIAVDEPVATENLIYNGTEQVGVGAADGYTLSGVSAAVDAGEYTATATLADGYKWADGSLEDKTITWSIAKAANEWITEPKISLESWIEGETVGELTDGVAKFGAVVVTMGGAEFTALPTAPGSYTIEYSVAETGNFSGLTKSVIFEITKYVPIISEITYENLRGATHTNPETYQERSVVEFTDPSEVEGYTFAGWTPERITADMTGAQTVRANWTANNYTIEYNSNGGSGTMESTLATYDSEAIVKDNEFIRDGYTFKGWALEEGADVVYAPKQSVMNLTAQLNGVVTFYAVWERILIAVDEPVATENLIYNGTEQVGVGAADGYTLSGVSAAVDAGEYTTTATLADGYKWADGSLEDKTITWSIAKAANEWITEPKISIESWIEGETVGELTDSVAKFGEVVVTMGGAEFTALPTAPGSYTIEYSVAETGNFSGLTKSVTFEILQKPIILPTIDPDWGYVVTELGENKNEVAVVFTNHTEKAMTWTVPDDIENVKFLVVGGGGGGSTANNTGAGGAGGGGVVTGIVYQLQAKSKVSVKVGAGGDGGYRKNNSMYPGGHGAASTISLDGALAVTAYGGARSHRDSSYLGECGSGNGSTSADAYGVAKKGVVADSAMDLVYGVESFGNNGGCGYNNSIGGGGGGAYPGEAGKGGNATKSAAGKGGAGLVSNITGEPITYGSGGGGSMSAVGASGGEGAGNGYSAKSAKANQGGGGGGAGKYSSGGKGGSGIVVIRYTIPSYLLPEDAEALPEVTDDSKVAAALEGSVDVKLVENIKTAAEYAAFREWALNLEGIAPEEVKASPNAWLSYALNTDKLIIAAPKEGDVVIDTFEIAVNEGAFEFTVKIDGIAVGDNALGANLRKVFEVEGAETLANGGAGFSSDNLEVNTATAENGNVKFTVTPKMENGEKPDSFFFRVKMK